MLTDKLAQILARGTLILSTDPAYPPQSYRVRGATRLARTRDIAYGSVGITYERMTRLCYTQPYSAEAERFFVRRTSSVTGVAQLSGRRLGGCGGCFAQSDIQRTLRLPGQKVTFRVDRAKFVGYDVERNGLADVAHGKLDGFLCGVAVGAKAIREGLPLRAVGGDQYVAYLSGAVDRTSGLSVASHSAISERISRRRRSAST